MCTFNLFSISPDWFYWRIPLFSVSLSYHWRSFSPFCFERTDSKPVEQIRAPAVQQMKTSLSTFFQFITFPNPFISASPSLRSAQPTSFLYFFFFSPVFNLYLSPFLIYLLPTLIQMHWWWCCMKALHTYLYIKETSPPLASKVIWS